MKRFITILLLSALVAWPTAVDAKQSKKEVPDANVAVRKIKADSKFLNIPVRTGAPQRTLEIFSQGKKVRELRLEFDAVDTEFWVNLSMEEWLGKDVEIRSPDKSIESDLNLLYQSNSPAGAETFYKEPLRPGFHFTAQRGWHNDPNGLVYYDGVWHLFFQHNPYGWHWGNMTWGHAVSSDLFHWTELGDAIHPDQYGTIFSGSAIVDKDNTLGFQKDGVKTLAAYYTYRGGDITIWSKSADGFSQGLAYSTDKGLTWTKFEEPIIGFVCDGTRDPKVIWDEGSKQWVMALYHDPEHGFGLFTSTNLKDWTEIQRLKLENDGECPDFFPIKVEGSSETKWVFSGASKNYVIGDFDGKKFTYDPKQKVYGVGKNFYASQTYDNAPGGRRVQISWMVECEFPGMAFNQQMSVPRDMKLYKVNGEYIIKSLPVPEIENVFGGGVHTWEPALLKGDRANVTSSFCGKMYALDAQFDVSKSKGDGFGFAFGGFEVYYSIGRKMLLMGEAGQPKTEVALEPENGLVTLKVLVDVNSVEIFANGGEICGAFAHFARAGSDPLKTIANGEIQLDKLTIREIKSIWKK